MGKHKMTAIRQSGRADSRRPRQERSRARVDAILNAAKALIGEKGSAGLKVQDIAQRAGVTPGSMYQYFPNKSAIIHALAKHYMDQIHAMLRADLAQLPDSPEACVKVMQLMLDHFYTLYRNDPVLRDILVSVTVDKTLMDMDIDDSRRNAALLYEHFHALFPDSLRENLKNFLFLAIHLSGSTVHLALRVEPCEADKLIAIAKQMISSALLRQFADDTI